MEEVDKKRVREVTKALADLDVFFSTGNDQNGTPTWAFGFTEGTDQIVINLQIINGWISVYHKLGEAFAGGSLPPEMMRQLLELNGRLAIAKVALSGSDLGVIAQVTYNRLSPESLREAIAAVFAGAKEVRALLGVSSPNPSMPPIQH